MNNYQKAGMVIGVVGYAIIIAYGGWGVAIGLAIATWGYGLQLKGDDRAAGGGNSHG
jgi:hypothetical protein